MRIAFLTHYTELYGANRSLLELIDGLGEHGVRAHVICPCQGDLLDVLSQRGIPVALQPFEWWVSPRRTFRGAVARLYHNIRNLGAIVAQLRRWQIDVVYSNSSVFPIGAMAAARLGRPHVWHIREFGDRDYDLFPDLGPRLFKRSLMTADATIFVSQALKRAYLRAATPPSAHVIYNGIARAAAFDERRRAAEAVRDRHQPFTFVLVGRFRASKGQAVAIRALGIVARRFPDVHLILVGDAGGTGEQSYFDHCRSLTNDLAVADRVAFWGYVADPERAFLAADVALMCSQNEAMGRVTVEAMSACRPVIGYGSGGTSELIAPERTGFLYRGEADVLAACMIRYIEAPNLARQHGEAAWRESRARYTTEAYAAQIHNLLRGLRHGNR